MQAHQWNWIGFVCFPKAVLYPLVVVLRRRGRGFGQKWKLLTPILEVAFVAFDIIGELTFSKPFGFIEKGGDISKAIEQNDTLNLYVTVFGHYRWASFLFMNPLINWFQMQSVNHTSEVAFTSIKERSKNPDARFDSYSYWHRGLEKAKRDRYANFTERGIVSAAVAYIGAGSSGFPLR